MTPARWARMKEIFSAAMEKPPDQRAAFLNETCADASLREDLWRLLEAEGQPSLGSPVADMLSPPVLPARFGRYRVIRLVGEGGMGAVYEAEQEQPRRRVAIKAIKPKLASHAMLWRF